MPTSWCLTTYAGEAQDLLRDLPDGLAEGGRGPPCSATSVVWSFMSQSISKHSSVANVMD